MTTVQTRLLGGHLLAVLVLFAGDLAGSTPVTAVGFAAVALTLAALFAVMTGALVDGVTDRPLSMLAADRHGQ